MFSHKQAFGTDFWERYEGTKGWDLSLPRPVHCQNGFQPAEHFSCGLALQVLAHKVTDRDKGTFETLSLIMGAVKQKVPGSSSSQIHTPSRTRGRMDCMTSDSLAGAGEETTTFKCSPTGGKEHIRIWVKQPA